MENNFIPSYFFFAFEWTENKYSHFYFKIASWRQLITFKCTWSWGSSAILWSCVVRRPAVRPSSVTFYIFNFSPETLEWSSTESDKKQNRNVLYQACAFQADRKNRMAFLASELLRHFRLLLWNRWTEFKETWHESRYQCSLPSLYVSCPSKKTISPLASDWVRHFRLPFWNRWTESNETWEEARA